MSSPEELERKVNPAGRRKRIIFFDLRDGVDGVDKVDAVD